MTDIGRDYQIAIEHIETLKANFIRICSTYPDHLDPENRYSKGHHAGYIAALSAAIDLIRSTAEMQAKYGYLPPVQDNVINLIDALKRTETPEA